jgi:hypothetical protein
MPVSFKPNDRGSVLLLRRERGEPGIQKAPPFAIEVVVFRLHQLNLVVEEIGRSCPSENIPVPFNFVSRARKK